MTNHEILGVTADATINDIMDAYLAKALECHPNLPHQNKTICARYADLNRAYNALINHSSQPLNDEQLFKKLLKNPDTSSETLCKWVIYLICTNNNALDNYSAAILNHYAFNNKTLITTRSEHYLLQLMLPTTHENLILSEDDILELKMQRHIVNDGVLYSILSSRQLSDSNLRLLHKKINTRITEKRVQSTDNKKHNKIASKDHSELHAFLMEEYNRVSKIFLELELENKYNRSAYKSLSLLNCYHESACKIYFCDAFVKKEFNQLSIDDQKEFLEQLMNDVNQKKEGIKTLKTLLTDNMAITIDLLFNRLSKKIQDIPMKPFFYYHTSLERRIAKAQKQLKTKAMTTQEEKIQWIAELAKDEPRCCRLTFFRSNQVQDYSSSLDCKHRFILDCKKWLRELKLYKGLDLYDELAMEACELINKTSITLRE